jgi:hypothetical protein
LPDPLKLCDEGGGRRIEGDFHPIERRPGADRRFLLDEEASPKHPRRAKVPDRFGDLGGRILAHRRRNRREQGGAEAEKAG